MPEFAGAGLLHRLFGARTLALSGELDARRGGRLPVRPADRQRDRAGRCRMGAACGVAADRATLIGASALCARYAVALADAGVAVEAALLTAAARGLWAIAQASGPGALTGAIPDMTNPLLTYLDAAAADRGAARHHARRDPAVGAALVGEGFRILEVPLNSPRPFESIAALAATYGDSCLVGAGTVLSMDDVARVNAAGGRLIVMPHADVAIMREAKRQRIVCVPGAATPTEAFAALAAGADGIKMFPAEQLPPAGRSRRGARCCLPVRSCFRSAASGPTTWPLLAAGGAVDSAPDRISTARECRRTTSGRRPRFRGGLRRPRSPDRAVLPGGIQTAIRQAAICRADARADAISVQRG